MAPQISIAIDVCDGTPCSPKSIKGLVFTGQRERQRERERERERKSRKCGRALSVPQSVSQSACAIIILIDLNYYTIKALYLDFNQL